MEQTVFIPLFKVFMPSSAHAALKPVLESGSLVAGRQVSVFESKLSAWLGHSQVTAVSDASGALTLALYMAGVRPGDEVITSPLACSATLMPIAALFATPIWCDVDPETGMIDPEKISQLISEKTRAILAYHWSGDVADIELIAAIAQKHGLKLVEDASEAFGATHQDKRLGGVADFSIYSFYATKHLNTGEGAALITKKIDDYEQARRLRRYGIDYSALRLANGDLNPCFDIKVAGFNLGMGEIAATIGIQALDHADVITEQHRENGRFYESALRNIEGLRQLKRRIDCVSAYWTFTFLAERRDDLIAKLASHGIGVQRLHLRNDTYTCFGRGQRSLPGVSEFNTHNLSIPCGWWLNENDRTRIVRVIREGW